MPLKPLRAPVRSIDADGREVVLVQLANTDKFAKLFPEDWERIVAAGYSPNWAWNCRAVRIPDYRANTLRAPRIIAGVTGSHLRVVQKDRNPLNLRRDNLIVKPVTTRRETH